MANDYAPKVVAIVDETACPTALSPDGGLLERRSQSTGGCSRYSQQSPLPDQCTNVQCLAPHQNCDVYQVLRAVIGSITPPASFSNDSRVTSAMKTRSRSY